LRCKRRAGEVVRSPPTPSPAASQVASLHLLVSHSEASHPAGAGSFPARARARARWEHSLPPPLPGTGSRPDLRPLQGSPGRGCGVPPASRGSGGGTPPQTVACFLDSLKEKCSVRPVFGVWLGGAGAGKEELARTTRTVTGQQLAYRYGGFSERSSPCGFMPPGQKTSSRGRQVTRNLGATRSCAVQGGLDAAHAGGFP